VLHDPNENGNAKVDGKRPDVEEMEVDGENMEVDCEGRWSRGYG
jgi:hypothetical protein